MRWTQEEEKGRGKGKKNVLSRELDLNLFGKTKTEQARDKVAPGEPRKGHDEFTQFGGMRGGMSGNLGNIMLARRDICKTTIVIKYFMQIYSYVVVLEFPHSQCSAFHKLSQEEQEVEVATL